MNTKKIASNVARRVQAKYEEEFGEIRSLLQERPSKEVWWVLKDRIYRLFKKDPTYIERVIVPYVKQVTSRGAWKSFKRPYLSYRDEIGRWFGNVFTGSHLDVSENSQGLWEFASKAIKESDGSLQSISFDTLPPLSAWEEFLNIIARHYKGGNKLRKLLFLNNLPYKYGQLLYQANLNVVQIEVLGEIASAIRQDLASRYRVHEQGVFIPNEEIRDEHEADIEIIKNLIEETFEEQRLIDDYARHGNLLTLLDALETEDFFSIVRELEYNGYFEDEDYTIYYTDEVIFEAFMKVLQNSKESLINAIIRILENSIEHLSGSSTEMAFDLIESSPAFHNADRTSLRRHILSLI